MIRNALFLLLFLFGFNFCEHFAHKQTDGFSVRRIQFHTVANRVEMADLDPRLTQQTFHYLDCGNQCYVFLSEDGQHILKLFKYANPPVPQFFTRIPLLSKIKPFRPHRHDKALWKRQRDFRGYSLAYTFFKEEAGLLAMHLKPSNIKATIRITDKLNIAHTLDLSTVPFIMQKRAEPIYLALQTLPPEEKKAAARNLVQLLKKRIGLNLCDDDAHFYSNFGFLGTSAIQTDPGHFTLGENSPTELQKLLIPLIAWCEAHDKTLIPVIENEAASR